MLQDDESLALALRGGLRGRFQGTFNQLENAVEVLDDYMLQHLNPAEYADLRTMMREINWQLAYLRRLGDHAADAAAAPVLQMQAFFVPSVQRRLTSRVRPSSRYRLTGRPTMATPARWPFAMQPRENLCPRTGLWWRWCSATNLFASARDIGFTVSIGSASISCTAVCRRHKGGIASNSS